MSEYWGYERLEPELEDDEPIECDECGHAISLHKEPYGCEHERGDSWVDGESMGAWMAMGPCGCKVRAETKRNVERALSQHGRGRSFLTLRRGA